MAREVIFMGREAAERFTPEKPAALISITDPDRPPAALDESRWEMVRRLAFNGGQYDEGTIRTFGKDFPAIFGQYITPDQADQISDFIEEVIESGLELLVVHCEAGMARSAAVAQHAHDLYGFALNKETNGANETVLRLLANPGGYRRLIRRCVPTEQPEQKTGVVNTLKSWLSPGRV